MTVNIKHYMKEINSTIENNVIKFKIKYDFSGYYEL